MTYRVPLQTLTLDVHGGYYDIEVIVDEGGAPALTPGMQPFAVWIPAPPWTYNPGAQPGLGQFPRDLASDP